MNELGQLLATLRYDRGWSLVVAARTIGSDHSYISRIERGLRVPAPAFIERVIAGYHLTTDEAERVCALAGMPSPTLSAISTLLHHPALPASIAAEVRHQIQDIAATLDAATREEDDHAA